MAPAICPDVAVGELVITELRGPQAGAALDTGGQWIELHNGSGADLDLLGLQLRPRTLGGDRQPRIIVRTSLVVAAGDYVVLGGVDDLEAPPATLDYNWYPDFTSDDRDSDSRLDASDLFDVGALDVEACGVRIDRIVYPDLPGSGTYAFGPAPDATGNDTTTAWCTDVTDDADATTVGLPGTPGAANRPCP